MAISRNGYTVSVTSSGPGPQGPQGPSGPSSATAGGLTNQVLTKNSGFDGDFIWTGPYVATSGGTIRVASPSTNGLQIGSTTETFNRLNISPDRLMWSDGKRAPITQNHVVGAIGTGKDAQFTIERIKNTADIIQIRFNRPGTITSESPTISSASGNFPMTSGTVTVSDASEIPSTNIGPNGLGRGKLIFPSTANDTFTRANSASTMGGSWVPQGTSVWGISSNRAYNVSAAAGANRMTVIETGSNEHEVTCTFSATSDAAANSCGLILNWVDSNNYVNIRFISGFGGVWNVYKVVGGVETFLFNSPAFTSHNSKIRAIYSNNVLYVSFNDAPYQTSITTITTAGATKAGFIASSAGSPNFFADDFTVTATTPCSWSGKTGNQLTGFTCTTATGTPDSTWAVRYEDGGAINAISIYDSFGAPIWYMKSYGGQHTTDNITMGGGFGYDVGMSFLNTAARTAPSLILYGDEPVAGTGNDNRSGMFLRRLAENLGAFGGRLLIRPSQWTDASGNATPTATATGTNLAADASTPYLGIGNADTGLWLAGTSPDIIGVSLDGTNAVSIAATGVTVPAIVFPNGTSFREGSGNPEGVVTATVGSTYLDRTNGLQYIKRTGTGNTGWVDTRIDAYAAPQPINAQTGTTYTLAATDPGKLITLTNAAAITLTVSTLVACVPGQRIDLLAAGAGQVTVAVSGTTVNATPGLKLRAQHSSATLICTATNTYTLVGDLSA